MVVENPIPLSDDADTHEPTLEHTNPTTAELTSGTENVSLESSGTLADSASAVPAASEQGDGARAAPSGSNGDDSMEEDAPTPARATPSGSNADINDAMEEDAPTPAADSTTSAVSDAKKDTMHSCDGTTAEVAPSTYTVAKDVAPESSLSSLDVAPDAAVPARGDDTAAVAATADTTATATTTTTTTTTATTTDAASADTAEAAASTAAATDTTDANTPVGASAAAVDKMDDAHATTASTPGAAVGPTATESQGASSALPSPVASFFATVAANTKAHGVAAWWWGSESDADVVAYLPSFATTEKKGIRAHVLTGKNTHT